MEWYEKTIYDKQDSNKAESTHDVVVCLIYTYA